MRHVRLGVGALVEAGALVFVTGAGADAAGGCPPGGGWQLVPASVGPAATAVDASGNNDGLACKTVFVNGSGGTVAQVIDNRVQARS